ncbi:MAG: NB-ARC domain-containing protein, partial [Prochloraceae cyanobacterium]
MKYHRPSLRKLINSLTQQKLEEYLDHFAEIRNNFTDGQAQNFRVKIILDYFEKEKDKFSSFLKAIENNNRQKYNEYIKNASESIDPPDAPIKTNPPQNLPRSGIRKFVGRDRDLKTLHQKLQQCDRGVVISPVASVTGMGGIGKTELALQYADNKEYDYCSYYPGGICWLNAREENIATQIINYAKVQLKLNPPDDLPLQDQVAYCWRNWNYPGDVLVIFDDVISYESIETLLPPKNPRFKTIITTRSQILGEQFKQLDLEVLDEDSSLELLRSLIDPHRIEAELEIGKQLCQQLGYLPLSLELIGKYLTVKQDLSLSEMQKRLEKKGLDHKSLLKDENIILTAKRGVKAAFELSWVELKKQAQELACFLSLFAVAPITWNLITQCLSDEDEEDLEDIRDYELVKLSLLQKTNKGIYQLHELIHQYFEAKLENKEIAEQLKSQFCQRMVLEAQKIPDTPTLSDIEQINLSIPHIVRSVTDFQQYLKDDDLIWPFTGLGRFYEGQG